jgi:methylglutaconyl-CoA hydratase
MTSYETLNVEIEDRGVAWLRLNRPEKRNALSACMIAELTEAAAQLGADPKVRVVVLAAQGDSFCAGGDLGWMRDQMAADDATRAVEARKLAVMLKVLDRLPKPLIGRVQGQAYGGGLGLMATCDVAIGVMGARFGLTETRLGLTPATIAPYILARMGAAMTRRVFASSRIFDAQEAVTLGLLARCVPLTALDAAIEAEIIPYLSCAPGAVADAKALIHALSPRPDAAEIDLCVAALVSRWDSAESAEGIAAFFEKRKPDWSL